MGTRCCRAPLRGPGQGTPGAGRAPILVLGVLLVAAGLASGCGGGKKKPPAPRKSATELYQEAETFMVAGKYGKAISRYEKVDTVRHSDLRAQVHLRLADAYFAQKHLLALVEAQSRYQSFLNFFPLSDQAPYAQYRYSVCLQRQINKPERDQTPTHRAIAEFHKVEQLYPNSSWVAEARERIDELEAHLTRDSLLKARFYYSRKAYTSATSRLQRILDSNPAYARMDEVLYYLGMSLRKSGRTAAGDVALQRVLEEHADSKYARRARKALRSTR